MSIKCPNCGNDLPDAANYCLHCCKSLDANGVNLSVDKAKTSETKISALKKFSSFHISEKKKHAFGICLLSLIALLTCFAAANRIHINNPQTEPLTETKPVTLPNGENVTDENGENVYETVEITTEKKSILDKIFSSSDKENTSKNSSNVNSDTDRETETTTKKSLFDKLFNSDKNKDKNKDKNTDKETSSQSKTDPDGKTETSAAENSVTVSSSADRNEETASTANTTSETSPSTTSTTEASSNTQPQTSETSKISEFQWSEQNGKIKITRYTGNASTVTVPAYIDGKRVSYLGEKVFSDNSNIKRIVFEGSNTTNERLYLPHNVIVFNNLPNLTTVEFPYETNSQFLNANGVQNSQTWTFNVLFTSCPKLSSVNFATRSSNKMHDVFFSVNGVVMKDVSTGSEAKELVYYPQGKTDATYTTPENVFKVLGNSFCKNPYIKKLIFGEKCGNVGCSFKGCTNLEEFKSLNNRSGFQTINGVLYYGSVQISAHPENRYTNCIYPPAKKDTYFVFPDNINLYISTNSFCGNPYIEKIKCPSLSYVDTNYIYYYSSTSKPVNLKTIMLNNAYGTGTSQVSNTSVYKIEYFN